MKNFNARKSVMAIAIAAGLMSSATFAGNTAPQHGGQHHGSSCGSCTPNQPNQVVQQTVNQVNNADHSVHNDVTGGSVGDVTASSGDASVGNVTSQSEGSQASNGDQNTSVDASTNYKRPPVNTAVAVPGGPCGSAFGAQAVVVGLSGSWSGEECMAYLTQNSVCTNAHAAVQMTVNASVTYNHITFAPLKEAAGNTLLQAYKTAQEQLYTCGAISQGMNPGNKEAEGGER